MKRMQNQMDTLEAKVAKECKEGRRYRGNRLYYGPVCFCVCIVCSELIQSLKIFIETQKIGVIFCDVVWCVTCFDHVSVACFPAFVELQTPSVSVRSMSLTHNSTCESGDAS